MSDVEEWWSGERVMKRWHIDAMELKSLVAQGLLALLRESSDSIVEQDKNNVYDLPAASVAMLLLKPSDVEAFEKEHTWLYAEGTDNGGSTLTNEEARELGRLRIEKIKWDLSISAAVRIGMYCATLDHPITHAELSDEVYKIDDKIPNTTIDKIWKAIPEDVKKDAGRPRKVE